MSDLKGVPGEMRATIHITRKATGKTETFEIVGHSDPDKLPELVAQAKRNRVHGAAGAMVGQGSIMSNKPKE